MSFKNKALKTTQYEHKQSSYEHTPTLPTRILFGAQTNSGKTTLICNLILDLYRDCWSKVVIFSHSWNTDSSWDPVRKYMKEKDWNLAECGFASYSDQILKGILDEQSAIIRWQKQHNHKELFGLLVIFDDMIQDRDAVRGRQIERCFTKGRHENVSCWVSTQAYRKVSNIVRMNADHEAIWKLRNGQDLSAWLEENTAIVGRERLLEIYNLATGPRFGYLWLKKTAHEIDDLLHPNGFGTPGIKIDATENDNRTHEG